MQVLLAAAGTDSLAALSPDDGSTEGGTSLTLRVYGHVLPEDEAACNCHTYVYFASVDTDVYSDRCAPPLPFFVLLVFGDQILSMQID